MNKEYLKEFRYQNIWLLIFLTIITLSIYFPFWFYRQTKVLNKNLPERRISTAFVILCFALTFLNIGSLILIFIFEENLPLYISNFAFEKLDLLFTYIWAFRIWERINRLLDTKKHTETWFSGLWTFFFLFYYLQFKINKLKKLYQNETP